MDLPGFSLDLASLGTDNRPAESALHDLLIIGGGPAAMTAAIYAARKLLKLAVLTKDFEGQTGTTSWVENYLGYQAITGRELAEKFVQHVRQFDVPMEKGLKARAIRRSGKLFETEIDDGRVFRAKAVLIATGKRSRRLGVPGETELAGKGVAYCSICDAPFFKDKRVVIAGGGNSAVTAAIDLLKVATSVTLVNYAPGWQADPILMEAMKETGRAEMLDNTEFVRVEGADQVTGVAVRGRDGGAERAIAADGVFVEIGLIPNSDLAKGLCELNSGGEIVVDCGCRTSVEGVFAAGDVTSVPHKQIIISAGEGAKAALSAYDYLTRLGKESA